MRYLALEILGENEPIGLRAIADDTDFPKPSHLLQLEERDSSVYGRALHYYLIKNGRMAESDGRVQVLTFGMIPIELLVGLVTLSRYIHFPGGIRYPYGLNEGSGRVEDIVNYIRAKAATPLFYPEKEKDNANKITKPRRKATPKGSSN